MLTEEQRKRRQQGIGGSDSAAILGLNPYKDSVGVWFEKTGRESSDDVGNSAAVHWGNVLEPVVLAEYERVTKTQVQQDLNTYVHPQHAWMLAHLDGAIPEQQKIVECKTANAFMKDHWGAEGSDEVPEQYLIQVQHYMAVTGYLSADVAVLIGGNDFRIYTVKRDDALIQEMIKRLSYFWNFHVLTDIAPEPSSKTSAASLWKKDNGETVLGDDQDVIIIDSLKTVKSEIKTLQKKKENLETEIVKRLGEASGLKINDALVATWRANKNGRRVLRIN